MPCFPSLCRSGVIIFVFVFMSTRDEMKGWTLGLFSSRIVHYEN